MTEEERHCRDDHAKGFPPLQLQYLDDCFELAPRFTWHQCHELLHRLASKHGEPPHFVKEAL
jgi:hypothetical protein